MLLAEELKSLTQKLKGEASKKEIVFFQFLINNPLPYPNDKNLSEQEQVVFAAFCSASPDKRELADKLRGTKPIKGIHYSNNLIDLAAFAKFDRTKETDNLKTYASAHSTRDYFILNKLFPDVLSYPPEPINAVDEVASNLLTSGILSNKKQILIAAIQSAEDLLDVYVVRESYLHLLDIQPVAQYKRDLSVFITQLARLIKRVDIIVRVVLTIGTGYMLFCLYMWLMEIIDRLGKKAEPIFTMIPFVIGGIEILILILVGAQPKKLGFIKAIVRAIGTIVLRIIGINRKEIEKRINDYQHESVDLLIVADKNDLPTKNER